MGSDKRSRVTTRYIHHVLKIKPLYTPSSNQILQNILQWPQEIFLNICKQYLLNLLRKSPLKIKIKRLSVTWFVNIQVPYVWKFEDSQHHARPVTYLTADPVHVANLCVAENSVRMLAKRSGLVASHVHK